MRAIDAWFDYQDKLKNMQAFSQPDDANTQHYPTMVEGKGLLELQTEICQHHTTTDQVPQSREPHKGQWGTRRRFSWNKGFLMAHKPPTRRLTPMSTP